MKNLLILMLVLGLVSVSQAQTIELTVGGSSVYSATPGETITIDLIADLSCAGFELMVVEGDASIATAVVDIGGTSAALTVGDKMTISVGYLNNYNGVLFDYYGGYASDPVVPQPAGTVIASFDYTISSAWDGITEYWVAPLVAGTSYEYMSGSFDSAALSYGNLNVAGVPTNVGITGLNIIPEPMTIALLSLGGLALLRRRT